MSEIVHMVIEGLFALIMLAIGGIMKTLYDSIGTVREDLAKESERRTTLELRLEREFLRHEDIGWIRTAFINLETGQKEMMESINKLRVEIVKIGPRNRTTDND